MKMTIAAIADTHVGDAFTILPDSLLDLLDTRKPDVILHAGDITEGSKVLPELSKVAPTIAVKGDNDLLDLPHQQWIITNGRKILLMHGDRSHDREKPSITVNKILAMVSPKIRWWNGYIKDLCRPFMNNMPDIIICGHLHFPFEKRVGQTLIINPGAVYMQGRGIQKNIPPSVAFITIRLKSIETEFCRLQLGNERILTQRGSMPNQRSGIREPVYAD